MEKLPQITDAELEVMNVIWQHAPICTGDIALLLAKKTNWSPKTVHTLLIRLTNKKAVIHEKEGRTFVYRPLIDRKDYLKQESNAFLDRFFDGSLSQLVSAFAEGDQLSAKEAEALKAILDQAAKKEEP